MTPARAGTTSRGMGQWSTCQDDPRSRGDDAHFDQVPLDYGG